MIIYFLLMNDQYLEYIILFVYMFLDSYKKRILKYKYIIFIIF